MPYSFNLVDRPWIPCLSVAGGVQELSLRDVFALAPTLVDLAGENALVEVALYRLLLAILHRVIGPGEEPDRWAALWESGKLPVSKIEDYLDRWRARFDLFDPERPFYQERHPRASLKSVISLAYELASGNNATLFDHHHEEEGVGLTPARAARAVLAAQAQGLGGLSPVPPERFTDGPAARGITFLVQGETLFETLVLNLIPYPAEDIMHTEPELDMPAWERDDSATADGGTPRGYLDYLTWQNRRVLLVPEDGAECPIVRSMYLGPGRRLDEGIRDPLKHYRRGSGKNAGWLVLRFSEERALWRDSAALYQLVPRGSVDAAQRPVEALYWLNLLLEERVPGLEGHMTRRLKGLGMSNNQSKVDFYRSEDLPLPLAMVSNQNLVVHLQDALADAERVRGQLWGATSTLAAQVLFHKEGNDLSRNEREERDRLTSAWAGERRYWAALGGEFDAFVNALPEDPVTARLAWRKAVVRAARGALEAVIAGLPDDTSSLKAAVLARGQLAYGLKKALPDLAGHEERSTAV